MTDSKSKSESKSSTEALVQTSETASVELSEEELGAVSGGASDIFAKIGDIAPPPPPPPPPRGPKV